MKKKLVMFSLGLMMTWVVVGAGGANAQSMVDGATAELRDAQGQVVGNAVFSPDAGGGVKVKVEVRGFTAAVQGEHGIHVHAVGLCEAPGFTTAAGHFNPEAKKHGLNNPEGHHAGDMPNLAIDAGGNGDYEATRSEFTLASGAANSLFDADGSALVIHAGPDDMATDPAGNSGARMACGVLTRAQVAVGMPRTGDRDGGNQGYGLLLPALLLVVGGLLLLRSTRSRNEGNLAI